MEGTINQLYDLLSRSKEIRNAVNTRIFLVSQKRIIFYRNGSYDISSSFVENWLADRIKFDRSSIIEAQTLIETIVAELKILFKFGFENIPDGEIDKIYKGKMSDKLYYLHDHNLLPLMAKQEIGHLCDTRNEICHNLFYKRATYKGHPLKDPLVLELYKEELKNSLRVCVESLHKLQVVKNYHQYIDGIIESLSPN